MVTVRPMLAGRVPQNLAGLSYPLLASPKLDGIRCLVSGGQAMSRKMKPIPNDHVQKLVSQLPDGLDGELMVSGGFSSVQSAIMSRDGEPAFMYMVFDDFSLHESAYIYRLKMAHEKVKTCKRPWLHALVHAGIESEGDLLAFERNCLEREYEGVILRKASGRYKFGRSTMSEGYLLKLKRYMDAEATVVGYKERMHNENDLETNVFGLAKRSSHRDGKRPAGDLGALICISETGEEFRIGSGFTAQERVALWSERTSLKGRTVTFKYQPDDTAESPRFPVFKGFREE